jgi:hypothetical protein
VRKPARLLVILFVLAVWPPALGVHDADSSVPSKSGTAQTVYPIGLFYRKQLFHSSAGLSCVLVAGSKGHAAPSTDHRPTCDEGMIGGSTGAGSLYVLMSLQL